MGNSRGVVASVLASLLLAAPVLAQPAAPTAKQKQEAGDLVKKAIAKSQAGDHQGAVDLYLQAYAIIPNSLLLSNVGTEYQQDAKPVEALKYFCMYLEKDPAGTNASYVTAQAKVIQVQRGRPTPDDAHVCAPDEPVVAPPPPEEHKDPVVVAPPPPPPPSSAGHGLKLAGMGVAAGGVVALGVGIVFGLKAKSISDDISDHCKDMDPCPEWPADIKSKEDAGQRDENIQIVGLIVGGALLAVGGGIYFAGRAKEKKAHESSIQVAPTMAPGTVGMSVFGSF